MSDIQPIYENKLPQENFSRFSQAPEFIPKYSIHNTLIDKDEFRKSVIYDYREQIKTEKRKSFWHKLLGISAVVGSVLLLNFKKII